MTNLTTITTLLILMVNAGVTPKTTGGRVKIITIDECKENFKKIADECVESSGITSEEIVAGALRSEDVSERQLCFLKCLFEKNDLIVDGVMKIDQIFDFCTLKKFDFDLEGAKKCLESMERVELCEHLRMFKFCIRTYGTLKENYQVYYSID